MAVGAGAGEEVLDDDALVERAQAVLTATAGDGRDLASGLSEDGLFVDGALPVDGAVVVTRCR